MKYFFIIALIFILSCSTNKVKNNHGVSSLNNKFNKIVVENSNSNDILNLLGPPSTKSSFDTNIWIYIERKKTNQSIFKLGKQRIEKNNVLVLELDERGILVKKELYDLNKMNKLLDENDGTIEDPVVLGSIYKLRGDFAHADGDHSSALKYYQKAESLMAGNAIQTKYQLDIVSTLLAQNNYDNALKILEEIIKNDDAGFNEKNLAEELLAYTKHKMGT